MAFRWANAATARKPGRASGALSTCVKGCAALLLACMLAGTPAQSADPIRANLSAKAENGYGRMVFTFDRLPHHKASIDGGVLVLDFDQPVSVDLRTLIVNLGQYLSVARLDPDGRAIRFALLKDLKVNTIEAGQKLFVDLLPSYWQGHPPGLPRKVVKELARRAADAERAAREAEQRKKKGVVPLKLTIRTGQHPTFSRISFNWNRTVDAKLSRDGATASVTFAERYKPSLYDLREGALKWVKGAKLVPTDTGMKIEIALDEQAGVRGFREGDSYVVDVTSPDRSALADPLLSGKEHIAISGAGKDKDSAPAKDAKKPLTLRTSIFDPAVIQAEENAAAAKAKAKDNGGSDEKLANAGKAAPKKSAAAKPKKQAGSAKRKAKRSSILARRKVKVELKRIGASLRLTFPFDEQVKSAAIRRARTFWIVFDTDKVIDLSEFEADIGDKISDYKIVRSSNSQYLQITLAEQLLTSVSSDSTSWIVTIGDLVLGKAKPLNVLRRSGDDGRSVATIAVKNAGRVHWIDDPEVGDRIAVITLGAPNRAAVKPQEFVEFSVLPTGHGVAIKPYADDLLVTLGLDELVIARSDGLNLSAGGVHQYLAGRKAIAETSRPGFIDLKGWQVGGPEQFAENAGLLERAVALSKDSERNKARLKLARLYIAHGLAAEALGVLRRVHAADPEIEKDPLFRAMRGAANLEMGRTRAARKDLSVHGLSQDPNTALWRTVLEARERKWQEALNAYRQGADALEHYPLDTRIRFRLAAIRAALETENFDLAASELTSLRRKIVNKKLAAEANVLRGRHFASLGRTEEAMRYFDEAIKSDIRPVVAKARYYDTELLLSLDKIDHDIAIERLETLVATWRGDDIELNSLRLLANLHAKRKDYRRGFQTMKSAMLAYPGAQITRLIQDDMSRVFIDLFLKGDAMSLSALDALGLFYDYKELVPIGRRGDEMIRQMADRLISVDLLDQASELLQHQVNKRLHGVARAQVASKLAMVHLMNRKPAYALRDIRQTRQSIMPTALKRERSLLEARALSELGRGELAMELLGNMHGEDVERLKADALWLSKNWQKAAEQVERNLGARWKKTAALSDAERADVMRAGIAYALAGDEFGLARLATKFTGHMSNSVDASAFALVTRPLKPAGTAFRDLAREVAASSTLDAFLSDFRKRYYPAGPDSAKPTAQERGGDKPARAG